jgi:hypothetical protein
VFSHSGFIVFLDAILFFVPLPFSIEAFIYVDVFWGGVLRARYIYG